MPRFLQILFRIAIIFAVIFFAIQPFNWFCQLTQSCRPFYFSKLLPRLEGEEKIIVDLEILSFRRDLEFKADKQSIETVTNRLNTVHYTAKNLSNRTIKFRPMLYIKPQELEGYIRRYQCLCFHSYKLKKGESIDLVMEFEIDDKIEGNKAYWSIGRPNLNSGNAENYDPKSRQSIKRIAIGYKIANQ